ncbi:MAG: integration host factor subunit beta [Planctomycetota bacterium]|nr:integration host factor subunit beta [Planctomycetota bacterium]MDA0917871.1 integration host factor subunit beta [Planctomycetota bacterium]MDA1159441.1 integration host factor subunit beta [Planctomycetota bacterium]
MTKKDIVKAISEQIGMTQLKTKEIVQQTFDAIIDTLVREHRIELRNFGVFEVKKRAARKARNPRTGERVDVAEKYVVTFKPGKEMEEKVRLLEQREAEKRAAEAAADHNAADSSTTSPPFSSPPTSSEQFPVQPNSSQSIQPNSSGSATPPSFDSKPPSTPGM